MQTRAILHAEFCKKCDQQTNRPTFQKTAKIRNKHKQLYYRYIYYFIKVYIYRNSVGLCWSLLVVVGFCWSGCWSLSRKP
nr:MAG TPA: hypothetical protein [Bacteriophage sp.]